jgi:O-antigen/teichoic acid export membrane protein
MLSGLVTNVAISAFAFFAVSVVGLLIVPVLIAAYGLAGFGLIALCRLFLPTAALAVLDLGYGEIATHSVAASRASGDWGGCARRLSLNLVVAGVVGLAAGASLYALAPWIPVLCRVPVEHQQGLAEVLRVTSLVLPVLLCSLVAEGVLKGFESFGAQRLVEVVSALVFAGGAVWAARSGLDFRWVCYALLASLLLRSVLAAGLAARALRSGRGGLAIWTSTERREFVLRARGLFQSKLLGVAQAQSPSLFVAILLGPGALGAFDLLSRMPRFAKSVLALLSSTVQPVAVRLDASADEQGLARLCRIGLILVAFIAAPVLGLAVAFSEPLLRLWLGPDLSSMWGWQAVYFIAPTIGALVSFGGSALLGRVSALSAMNRTSLVNVVIVIALGLALSPWLSERAFIASQFAAALVSVPWHLAIVAREIGLQRDTFVTVARLYLLSLTISLPSAFVLHHIDSLVVLAFAMAGWTIVCWIICLGMGLPLMLRIRIWSMLAAKLRVT